jgi:hypothetical protein
MLSFESAADLCASEWQQHIGDAAEYILSQFKYMVRFVDDLTSGPNRLLADLLYTRQSVMGGLVQGIYPHEYLELEPTNNPPMEACSFPTLDVRLCSWTTPDPTGRKPGGIVKTTVVLYDKRMESFYSKIPIVRYTSASSTLSIHSGYNILLGQLHRFSELIMDRNDFVTQVAKLVLRMQARGYAYSILRRKLRRWCQQHRLFGETSWCYMFRDLIDRISLLRSGDNWEAWQPPPANRTAIPWAALEHSLPCGTDGAPTKWHL